MLAGLGDVLHDEGVRIGAGGDQDGFDFLVRQQFVVIPDHTLDAEFIGHCLGNLQADVADRHQVRFGDEPGDVAGVDAAHAPGADHGDLYFSCHISLFALKSNISPALFDLKMRRQHLECCLAGFDCQFPGIPIPILGPEQFDGARPVITDVLQPRTDLIKRHNAQAGQEPRAVA